METKATIWEKASQTYIPILLLFFGVIAGATCIGTKPFFPVGVSGIVMILFVVFSIYYFFKKKSEIKNLQSQLDASYHSIESVTKKYKSDLAKKEETIKELEADVELLKAQIKALKEEETKPVEEVQEKKKTSKKK